MPNVSSPAALPQYIEQLLAEHKHHSAALATIESTLARVTAALGGTTTAATSVIAKRKPGRPPVIKAAVVAKPVAPKSIVPKPVVKSVVKSVVKPAVKPLVKPATKTAPAKVAPAQQAPKKPGMTANDFVLAFVEAKKNPTSQEVNKAWKDAGRLGLADNNLSLLTKAKKLKRTPLGKGLRGSRYTIA